MNHSLCNQLQFPLTAQSDRSCRDLSRVRHPTKPMGTCEALGRAEVKGSSLFVLVSRIVKCTGDSVGVNIVVLLLQHHIPSNTVMEI